MNIKNITTNINVPNVNANPNITPNANNGIAIYCNINGRNCR